MFYKTPFLWILSTNLLQILKHIVYMKILITMLWNKVDNLSLKIVPNTLKLIKILILVRFFETLEA